MDFPADFNKIYGSTSTGGLTPISDVNYAKGWEFVGSNPPTKNDFSYLQKISDLKSQWLYNNKLQRTDPFGDIKSDGTVSQALSNLGLGGVASLREVDFTSSGSWTCPPGVTEILLDGCGAGGAGATVLSGVSSAGGGGGGGGSVVGNRVTVVPGTVYTITIGLGGVPSSTTGAGTKGGDTSFGTLVTLVGGNPGGVGATGAGGTAGGAGGQNGIDGRYGSGISFGGSGGGTLLGSGGAAGIGNTLGSKPGQFGGGGGGGAAGLGGAGANGFIRIRW